ncbi:MAG: hypothetical protein WA906_01950 [Pacificimonas sp.]
MTSHFPIWATLVETARTWWRDFAPITFLGLGLLVLPETIVHLTGGHASDAPTTETLVSTVRALTLLMFVSAITAATMASVGPLEPRIYVLAGLKRMQAPLVTGLSIAAALVTVAIGGQLLALFTVPALIYLATPIIAALIVLWFAAMPAATALDIGPLAALRRSAQLTRQDYGRLCGLVALVVAILLPIFVLLAMLVYGVGFTEPGVPIRSVSLGDVGFWVGQLARVLIVGIVAVVPPVAYRRLVATA